MIAGLYREDKLGQYKEIKISIKDVFKGRRNCLLDVWILRMIINHQNQ